MCAQNPPAIPAASGIAPRLLRIPDAAHYLSCTYGFMEALIREKTIPSWIQGKRRVIDIRDLDEYIERIKLKAKDPSF